MIKSITDNKWAGTHTAVFTLTMPDKGTLNTLSKPLNYTLNIEVEANQSDSFSSSKQLRDPPVAVRPIEPTY